MPVSVRPDLYVDDTDVSKVVVTGTDVSADTSWFSKDRDVIIRCARLVLPSEIRLPGGNIVIAAKDIVCDPSGSKVIVSSPKTKANYIGSTARHGATHSENGTNGEDGGTGADGGTVKIRAFTLQGNLEIVADGADGGGAQSGGNGANGRNAVPPACPATAARPAGNGGKPGLAGTPGSGGNGGTIDVLISQVVDAPPAFSVAKGKAGMPGVHGQPGKGGKSADGVGCRRQYWSHCDIAT